MTVTGFLNLHKPAGLTSHDCVARVRKLLKQKRVGHGGTLDPMATGVLPIALGRATRLLQYLPEDKAYQGTVRFGVQTDTDDLDGEIIASQPVSELSLDSVKAVLPQFQGTIQQIPPRYSAIQIGGKRLYDLARAGQAVDVPVRTVTVYSLEILDWRSGDFPELDLAISCGTGTYIRAIARDLGTVLGTGATLAALLRTRSSGFTLDTSLPLEELAEQVEAGTFQPLVSDRPLTHFPSVTLEADLAMRWCQGQRVAAIPTSEHPNSPCLCRIYTPNQNFCGIGEYRLLDGQPHWIPRLVMAPNG
jgi:tRNA pseudouridine55 synthase